MTFQAEVDNHLYTQYSSRAQFTATDYWSWESRFSQFLTSVENLSELCLCESMFPTTNYWSPLFPQQPITLHHYAPWPIADRHRLPKDQSLMTIISPTTTFPPKTNHWSPVSPKTNISDHHYFSNHQSPFFPQKPINDQHYFPKNQITDHNYSQWPITYQHCLPKTKSVIAIVPNNQLLITIIFTRNKSKLFHLKPFFFLSISWLLTTTASLSCLFSYFKKYNKVFSNSIL